MTIEDVQAENEHLRRQLAMRNNVDTLADEVQQARSDEQRALQEVIRLEDKLEYWKKQCESLAARLPQKKQGVCEVCGARFETMPGGHKRKRFCSARCRQASSRENRYVRSLEQHRQNRVVTIPNVTLTTIRESQRKEVRNYGNICQTKL